MQSEFKSIKQRQQDSIESLQREGEKFTRALNIVLQSTEGQYIFRQLYRLLGKEPGIKRFTQSGELDVMHTMIQAERREIYMLLRRMMDPQLAILIEQPEKKES